MLSSIAERNSNGINKIKLQDIFIEHYVDGYYVIDKRLHKQLIGQNIYKFDKQYFITSKGKRIYKTNQLFATIFNVDKKLLENILRKSS